MFQTGTKELFQKYMNRVLIETGSFLGDGIQAALDAGFKEVYSLELDPTLFNHCVDRFAGQNNVHLIPGDSVLVMDNLLSKINEPVTFWLDGHNSGTDMETGIITTFGIYERPVMQELIAIQKHYIKTHTLMIDDMRLWTIEYNGYDEKTIIEKCLEINPLYRFTYEDGYIPNDILIAWL